MSKTLDDFLERAKQLEAEFSRKGLPDDQSSMQIRTAIGFYLGQFVAMGVSKEMVIEYLTCALDLVVEYANTKVSN